MSNPDLKWALEQIARSIEHYKPRAFPVETIAAPIERLADAVELLAATAKQSLEINRALAKHIVERDGGEIAVLDPLATEEP